MADSTNLADVATTSLGVGLAGGAGAAASATVSRNTEAFIGTRAGEVPSDTTVVLATGAKVLVSAVADSDARVFAQGGAFGGAAAGGFAGSATVTGSTRAYIGEATTITGAELDVVASATEDAKVDLGVLAAGGAADAGASSNATVDAVVQAFIGIPVGASPSPGATTTVTTIAAGLGDGSVNVSATADKIADADAKGLGTGALQTSVMLPTATVGGATQAMVGGAVSINATGISVNAVAENYADAQALVEGISLVGGAGATAHAEVLTTADVEAIVGAGVVLAATGVVEVRARHQGSKNKAHAAALGGSSGALGASATMQGKAIVGGGVTAGFDGTLSSSSQLTVEAEGDNIADADTFVIGFGAGFGGGGAGAEGTVTSDADVLARIASTASITTSGAVVLSANSDNNATADSDAGAGGIVGFGTTLPTATVAGSTKAELNGDIAGATGLTVTSTSDNDASATAIVISFGVYTNSKGLADAKVTSEASTEALVESTASLAVPGGDVLVDAISDDNATAHTTGGEGAAISLVTLQPTATVEAATKTFFDGDLPDVATDAATVTVRTRTGNTATANAEIVNMTLLGSSAGASAKATVTGDNEASIGPNASIQTTGLVSVDAGQNGDNNAGAHVVGLSTGIVALGSVGVSTKVAGAVRATMDGVITGAGALTVQADGNNLADSDAFVGSLTAGSLTGAGASAEITDTADVEATLSSAASIHVAGAVLVTATSDNDARTDADTAGGGGVTQGGSSPTATVKGGTKAQLDGDVVDTNPGVASPLTVRATSDNDATAEAVIAKLGAFTSSIGFADANVTSEAGTEALVGSTASLEVLGGAVLVEAISDNNVTAHTAGGDLAAISLLELHPTAKVDGATKASFDGDLPDITTDASSLTVRTRTGNTAQANAEIANMTLLGGGGGAQAEASVTGDGRIRKPTAVGEPTQLDDHRLGRRVIVRGGLYGHR